MQTYTCLFSFLSRSVCLHLLYSSLSRSTISLSSSLKLLKSLRLSLSKAFFLSKYFLKKIEHLLHLHHTSRVIYACKQAAISSRLLLLASLQQADFSTIQIFSGLILRRNPTFHLQNSMNSLTLTAKSGSPFIHTTELALGLNSRAVGSVAADPRDIITVI